MSLTNIENAAKELRRAARVYRSLAAMPGKKDYRPDDGPDAKAADARDFLVHATNADNLANALDPSGLHK